MQKLCSVKDTSFQPVAASPPNLSHSVCVIIIDIWILKHTCINAIHLQAALLCIYIMFLAHFHTWNMVENISLATSVVTERNRELVAQGLCVKGKKRFVRKANANWRSLSRFDIPGDSVTIDRWWQNREVGWSRGAQGVPQTLGKKNECSHCADTPIPQSGPLAATEFLHGEYVRGTTQKQTGAHREVWGHPAWSGLLSVALVCTSITAMLAEFKLIIPSKEKTLLSVSQDQVPKPRDVILSFRIPLSLTLPLMHSVVSLFSTTLWDNHAQAKTLRQQSHIHKIPIWRHCAQFRMWKSHLCLSTLTAFQWIVQFKKHLQRSIIIHNEGLTTKQK